MIALIDADIVGYRCAATAEDSEEWVAVARTNELIELILKDLRVTEYKLFLTGKNNFRKKIYPEYKANRTKPLPKHLQACREFMVKEWNAEVTDGYEADDALGMEHCLFEYPNHSVIVSIDKDLKQIPGNYYHFVKKELINVSPETAIREFYTQLLVGDPGDNIKGCPGIGKVKAQKLLDGCESEEELFDTCREAYQNDEMMLLNGQLLWIWRSFGDIWKPPYVLNVKNENQLMSFPQENIEEKK